MNSYQISIIVQACIAIISVVGIFALTGLAGMFSLGQAGYMALGAYITFILAKALGVSFWLTAILGIGISMLIAYIAALPTVRLRRDYFALITVGLGQAINALLITFSGVTNGSQGFTSIPKVKGLVWIVLGVTVLVIFMVRNLKYSRFGRMAIALKNDELVAKSFGIDVYKLKTHIYVFVSGIAAVAGIIFALQNRVLLPESFGWTASSEMEIFLFFGGTNSLTGAIVSAGVLKSVPELFRSVEIFGQSLQEYRTIIYCLLIILVLNFRTNGLFGEYELSTKSLKRIAGKIRKKKRVGGD
ncbi:MAG: branched-chain amino acid ABC transporter permease [Oscillospiraceae bacterium]